MFRLFSAIVFLSASGVAFAQSDDLLRDLDRNLNWDSIGARSRTRFGPVIFGEGIPEKLNSENFRFSGKFRLGVGNDDSDSPPPPLGLPDRGLVVKPGAVPSANTPVPVDAASSPNIPIRRPVGFFQRSDVMQPNFVLEEPTATPREQRWFREFGSRREEARAGTMANGIGRGASGLGGEETLHPTPNAPEPTIRTPTPPPQNSGLLRQKLEERLEGMLLSDPNVHLLSPVRISVSGGTATVRGVVPNQSHKIAVGNILLSDPAVKQVNNMISVAPLDPNHNPPPIEGR